MQSIMIRQQVQYGAVRWYPVCSNAKVFAELTGTTTLTDHALRQIKALGFAIRIQKPEVVPTWESQS